MNPSNKPWIELELTHSGTPSMQIILNRRLTSVPWQLESDNTREPDTAEDQTTIRISPLSGWNGHDGMMLSPWDPVDEIADLLGGLTVVALDYSNYSDGRSYSQAVALRTQFGFNGEVLGLQCTIDNLSLMENCGVNAFLLKRPEESVEAIACFEELEPVYSFPHYTGVPGQVVR